MNITAVIEFAGNNAYANPVNTLITYPLIKYLPISDILNCITKFINDIMNTQYQNQRVGDVDRYNMTDHNGSPSSIFVYSDIPAGLNLTIEFSTDSIKLFSISEDHPNLMNVNGLQTIAIPLDTNYHTKFQVWNQVQLFLHASFSEAKNQYVCKNNEFYHKLAKKCPLNGLG
jgi:hypothetical protein